MTSRESGSRLDGHTAETLASLIREDIEDGTLPVGSRLPSIRDYVDRGVSKWVAETALARLRAEGLLESRHGAGTFVRSRYRRTPRVVPGRTAASQWGSGKAIQDHDQSPRPRTVDVVVGDVVPPAEVADALGVKPGAKVLSRSRRFVMGDQPVQLSVSYLPTELTRGTQIEHTDTGPGGTYARLAELGHAPTRFQERVIGRAPSPDEAKKLDLRRNAIVFDITRFAYAGDRCVEVNRMVLDAEVYELVTHFPA